MSQIACQAQNLKFGACFFQESTLSVKGLLLFCKIILPSRSAIIWYNYVMVMKIVATNRKAFHNYNVQESLEAGIALTGTEIKSIRAGRVNLADAYIKPEAGELWLLNAHIARYEAGSYMSHEPLRPRRLLMHRKEIKMLASQVAEKGLTLVPLRLYLKDSLAKVDIALAKGKRLYDKRETLMRRETDREMERATKRRRDRSAARN